MEINYQAIYDSVKIGDKENLQYNGSYEVPKFMSGQEVTIIGFTKQKVKVDNGIETFNIRYDQIRRISQEIQKQQRTFTNIIKI